MLFQRKPISRLAVLSKEQLMNTWINTARKNLRGDFMIDIQEELKEVSANLRLVKAGMQQEDNKEEIDRALWLVIKSVDHIVEEIDKTS